MKSNCCGAEPCDGPFECVGCEKCNRQVPPLTPAQLKAAWSQMEAMIRWPTVEDDETWERYNCLTPDDFMRWAITYALQDLRNKKQ